MSSVVGADLSWSGAAGRAPSKRARFDEIHLSQDPLELRYEIAREDARRIRIVTARGPRRTILGGLPCELSPSA